MINNKYKTAKEYFNIVRTMNHFKTLGIETFTEKHKLKFICGCVLFGVGVVFIPVPLPVGIPLIMFACGLMGYTMLDVRRKRKDLKSLIKYKIAKYKNNKKEVLK